MSYNTVALFDYKTKSYIHCNLVIMLIPGVKRNERYNEMSYNEMHLLNGMKCIVMYWRITWENIK